jgi:hypothetical protein
MRVSIHLVSQSQPIVRSDAMNTYVKAGLFCVYRSDGTVEKYPLESLFRVVEDYTHHSAS